MKFSLATIAYVFALLAAGMALFGSLGVFASGLVLLFWALMLAKPRQAVWMWLGVVAFVVIALLLLAPAVATARNAAMRNMCLNNLKAIMLALENYRMLHGAYPPAYIAGADGRPMHSWRVLILPYMEHGDLYEEYDFDEPWDGPNNRKLWDRMPEFYACPEAIRWRQLGGSRGAPSANVASYVAIIGKSTAWPGGQGRGSSEFTDRGEETLMVLEYSGGAQPWTAPVDLSEDEAIDLLASRETRGHLHTSDSFFRAKCSSMLYLGGFVDARAKALWPGMPRDVVKAMLTVGGGEDLDQWEEFESSRWVEPTVLGSIVRWDRVYGLTVFAVLAVLPGIARLVRKATSSEGSPAS
jgi:type II secretory pathway pseudopilin PulG